MLWEAILWEDTVTNEQLPEDLDNPLACSKELAREPCLHRDQTKAMSRPVLDLAGN